MRRAFRPEGGSSFGAVPGVGRAGFVSPRNHIWTESRECVQIALVRETNLLARISRVPRAADKSRRMLGRPRLSPAEASDATKVRQANRRLHRRPELAWNWPIRPSRTCSMTSWRDSIAA